MSGIPSRLQQPSAFGGSPRKSVPSSNPSDTTTATNESKLPSPSLASRSTPGGGIPVPSGPTSSAAAAPGTGRRSLPAPSSWHHRGVSDEDRVDTPSRLRHPQLSSSIAPVAAGKSDSPMPLKSAASAGTALPRTPAPRRSLAPKGSFGSRTPGFGASTAPEAAVPPPPLPKQYEASTIASTARTRERSNSTKASEPISIAGVELGQIARFVSDGQTLEGIVRYLGRITGKSGDFAGLELLGESEGKGKNDGIVNGEQYFACGPLCGVFCRPHQLQVLRDSVSNEATARPQSAMSHRSGRSSVAGEAYSGRSSTSMSMRRADTPEGPRASRPPSSMANSLRRPASRLSLSASRNASATPHSRPPSSMSQTSATSSRPDSRLAPRKSHADLLLDEDGRKRAKISAKAAAEAEARIREGSRASKFMKASAADLAAKREAGMEDAGGPRSTSPLKDSLMGRARSSLGGAAGEAAKGGVAGARWRTSGAEAPGSPHVTPRPMKARSSGPALTAGDMGPPGSPSRANGASSPRKSVGSRPTSSLSAHMANADGEDEARTPLKSVMARLNGQTAAGSESNEQVAGRRGHTAERSSVHLLLEEMDLTPRRPPTTDSKRLSTSTRHDPSIAYPVSSDEADTRSPKRERSRSRSPIKAGVSSFEHEELKIELQRLKENIEKLETSASAAALDHARDKERVRASTAEETRKEVEEERTVEKADEARRRREAEEREAANKQRAAQVHADEMQRVQAEGERRVADVESRLKESEALVNDLKASIGSSERDGEALKAKEAEITHLKERAQRVEQTLEAEREKAKAEIQDLLKSGSEMSAIYEEDAKKREEEAEQRVQDAEARLREFADRAQTALREVEAQREAALAQVAGRVTAAPGSAAAIDLQTATEQLAHEKAKASALEDQLEELRHKLEEERENARKRKERTMEAEQKLRDEGRKAKADVARMKQDKMEAESKAEELDHALQASRAALESERAELETMRAEAQGLGGGPSEVEERASADKARLEGEIERLNTLLEAARSGKREASKEAGRLRIEMEELQANIAELQGHLPARAFKSPAMSAAASARMSREISNASPRPGTSPSVDSGAFANGTEAAGTSPSLQHSRRISNASSTSRRSRGSLGPSAQSAKDELTGLRILVGTLSEEVSGLKVSKQDLQASLEETRHELLAAREQRSTLDHQLADLTRELGAQGKGDVVKLTTELNETKAALDRSLKSIETMERQLKEANDAHERSRVSLQQEITDLEALCEASVYRRDEQQLICEELERKVAKLQRQIERSSSSASLVADKTANEPMQETKKVNPPKSSRANEDDVFSSTKADAQQEQSTNGTIETTRVVRTEQPETPAPAASVPTTQATSTNVDDDDDDRPFCDDCEEYGHTLEQCTINDVF
ncbi:hypothetical protein IE81DRAFT_338786 [Ceraceosorus guamensis]|uniref:CAP-Gly domain-containing protein n=1 Tax=Ceraceosorus guamensis TaxID=1522189 RepID=A0A316W955_9BASI|nr:hypothetical protein IE81DRAFT_338786 [Ceraceosorus guamensis]PWN46362.1 hypothetical protein IE81DRAFT_338786 [Ceraceosorus guamensis]